MAAISCSRVIATAHQPHRSICYPFTAPALTEEAPNTLYTCHNRIDSIDIELSIRFPAVYGHPPISLPTSPTPLLPPSTCHLLPPTSHSPSHTTSTPGCHASPPVGSGRRRRGCGRCGRWVGGGGVWWENGVEGRAKMIAKYNEPRQQASSTRSIRSSTRFDAGVCGWLGEHVYNFEGISSQKLLTLRLFLTIRLF